MKTITNFKTGMLHATLITATLFGVTSCNNNKPKDTKDVAMEHNDAKFDNNGISNNNNNNGNNNSDIKEKDTKFLVKAAEINLDEIQLGQLAQKSSRVKEVKDLGKMMEEAHTKSMKDLTALANKKMITIPSSPTDKAKDDYKKLSNTSGLDFDKKYTDMMVKGHKDAIDLFEKASKDSEDTEIRDWATSTLPALRMHLDHAMNCQKKLEKNVIISMKN